ncbi:patatin-like phospholipase family protein [Flavobacterium macacae]|uniref:Patatin-like phospholipase family protein n=1 Tax=Flavobacterium macacae TaxID=2488993 RepID=A0A3P3WGK4_9FLAO|nr:patatin-like phospholipase family protein [Flavobacterium macacae]RRJ93547.1 patatin-like phospholipase family protein [Flavobacterium macacae]
MRALVISGGGSKGAFAGGVAQYLIQEKNINYDLYLGSSTGSLLIPHLALNREDKIFKLYTNVDMEKIFSVNPFIIKHKKNQEVITINHFNVAVQFMKGRRTFGESKNLKNYIRNNFSEEEFLELKKSSKDIIVTVTNITKNCVEYKSILECGYDDFCDWIWISCNYIPFMSLVTKNNCEYADGGISNVIPIQEAIHRGATEIDVIVLETEHNTAEKVIGKNPFSLTIDLFGTIIDQVEKKDIIIGRLAAASNNVKLNFYYTPTKLTDNPLVFNKKNMLDWWKQGFDYAKNKSESMSQI